MRCFLDRTCLIIVLFAFMMPQARTEDAVSTVSFKAEVPSFHSLGFRWLVEGDANANAAVEVRFRESSTGEWRSALSLHRVEPEAMETIQPPEGQFLFAGSIMFLKAGTSYDVELSLRDPDNKRASIEKHTLQTLDEEQYTNAQARRVYYVQPASQKQGNGSKEQPFAGIDQAVKQLQAGDHLLLLPGTYISEAAIRLTGKPGQPIVLRGSGQDAVIIKGGKNRSGLDIGGSQYVQIENLTIADAYWGLRAIACRHLTIKDCFFKEVGTGIFSDSSKARRLIIMNNHIEGVLPFPYNRKTMKTKYTGELRGIDVAGSDHIFAYNTVHGFRDGIDVRGKPPLMNVDMHNNEIYECYDDGMELDNSDQNVRCFYNRISNCGGGISFQPIHGGPVYVVRNVLYNLRGETWKIHLSPTGFPHRTSGAYIFHNTVVRSNPCFRVWSNEGPGHYFTLYNNLYVGTGGPIEVTCPMLYTRMDYNAYIHDGQFKYFAYWNKKKYKTLNDFSKATGLGEHSVAAVYKGGIFSKRADFPKRDTVEERRIFDLHDKSPLIDRGVQLPSINDGFDGKAPDIGALEHASEPPHYGIRH